MFVIVYLRHNVFMIKLHSGTNKYFIIKVTKVNLKLLVLYDKDKDE